jgi:hypothetical protein
MVTIADRKMRSLTFGSETLTKDFDNGSFN